MKPRARIVALLVVLALLALIYAPTLLAQINGSSDDFMADVGETQIVLNVWGTLHATGYPLFVILGNLFVGALRLIGIAPTVAPSIVSLIFGFAALAIFYALALNLTGRVALAAMATALLGVTRYVWIHNVIPEVYSFALLLLTILFAFALWRGEVSHRIEWLAFVGGIALAHHRAFILAIPPLAFAVWHELPALSWQRTTRLIALGLIGFVPYAYLPARANLGGIWVYGNPGTLSGFWDQFIARENPAIVRVPTSFDIVLDKFNTVNDLLVAELTAPGIALGILGLTFAAMRLPTRREAITFLVSAITAYAFVVIFFDDILAPVIFPISLALVFGWIFLSDALVAARKFGYAVLAPAALVCGAVLVIQNAPVIARLTHDPTGVETMALAQNTPTGATLMLTWGTRYFAIGFAQDVLEQLQHFRRVDDKADVAAILKQGMLVTPEFILTDRPPPWFEKQLKQRVYVRAVAPRLIQIDTAMERVPPGANIQSRDGLPVPFATQAHCARREIDLYVSWAAITQPARDASVFVHLLDANGHVLAQDDQAAPVYGWRPLTSWDAGEVVRDVYTLAHASGATQIRFGWYEKLSNGEFKNYDAVTMPVLCNP
ncbi:MAG: DUF2723 domain-containing protein [Chloroflexi bacterium]|nr:DUF2723 domain-containing protein [Chloroflexota bacterium]